MIAVNAAQAAVKTVADPNAAYESLKPLWDKSRAVCSGERYVKDFDSVVDTSNFTNLLIPFSPSMTQEQFNFYKAEAELPGITAQFHKMLVGGLLRKKPVLMLPKSVPPEASDWIMNKFGRDDSPLSAYLTEAVKEEVITSRAWVFIDYPSVNEDAELTPDERKNLKPYPVLHRAESIVNWRVSSDAFGKNVLDRVIIRGFSESYAENEFHPTLKETVWVHDLDETKKYRIRIYRRSTNSSNVPVANGQIVQNPQVNKDVFVLEEVIKNIMIDGERIGVIPAWPLNGSIDAVEPMLMPIIDKEISLYNKISRRNHLLYGASTYTPIVTTDMTDEAFDDIVNAGLGSWIKLNSGDTASVLETPTAALADMDRAIASSLEEMAKLGIRMLSPETEQSGIALEIRNAAQTAQLGTLNSAISNVMRQVIAFMLNWRYALDVSASEIQFSLSADFNPTPLGADWLRLATEWYQGGLIPRSVWIQLLKQNDLIEPDYDDIKGQQDITADAMTNLSRNIDAAYAEKIATQKLGLDQPAPPGG